MTAINRRKFCQLLAAGTLLPSLSMSSVLAATGKTPLFASAAKAGDNDYRLYVAATDGSLLLDHKLPTGLTMLKRIRTGQSLPARHAGRTPSLILWIISRVN
ncbi:hypothetical protein [Aliamphritea spongicola]|nr:hypothetical protein [Aliamphritea spongicola]